MGTNFYARIIPSEESKTKLKKLIDNNDFNEIKKLTHEIYSRLYRDGDEILGGEVHLGKRSGGWKFLWNPNVYVTRELYKEDNQYKLGDYIAKYTYPLTKEGIKTFINRNDVEIYNEYNEKQNKDEFFEMAINWTTWKNEEGLDSKTYYEKYPDDYDNYICNNDLTKYLTQINTTFISKSKTDFYSDGLRFATSTDFS